jgi:hypothetical protein
MALKFVAIKGYKLAKMFISPLAKLWQKLKIPMALIQAISYKVISNLCLNLLNASRPGPVVTSDKINGN